MEIKQYPVSKIVAPFPPTSSKVEVKVLKIARTLPYSTALI